VRGFRNKRCRAAKAVAQLADGVVVGSVLVEKMGALAGESPQVIAKVVGDIIGDMRRAIDTI
jgi:tryptophan synthase alpha chain